jgi:photosystem II stability/assembly factor-like uncharacterized protein
MYCRDPSKPKSYDVIGSYKSAPGAITTSIETQLNEVADYLERIVCPFPLYILKMECGRMDVFNNYARALVLLETDISSEGYDNMVSRQPEDENPTLQTFDLEAQSRFHAFDLHAVRQSTTETEAINDVHFCGQEICEGDCGPAQSLCEFGLTGGDTTSAGSPEEKADVLLTEDGATWDPTAANPFAAAEIIAVTTCFPIGGGVTRLLVGRGTTDGSFPAEIAYSDDDGVNWTPVNVGVVDGQYFTGPDSIFVLDMYNIWAVTTGGYIYYSEDAGATWEAQEEGVITGAGNFNCVHFVDRDYGFAGADADVIASTIDGGGNWAAVTPTGLGGDVDTIRCLSQYRAWIGTDDGRIFFTHDAGTLWEERAYTGSGAGAVPSIDFYNMYVGALINTTGGTSTVLHTIDGGFSWRPVTVPANSGLNSIFICEPYLMYAVGERHGHNAMILKITD